MEGYLKRKLRQHKDHIAKGVNQDEYWKYVGKISALEDITRDFNRMIEVKNKLFKKNENG